ncbi:aspartate/glutamate racemase family protein [Mesorhizobium sp. M0633]|uniref:aspartate/glutamate racemase family protein n=1 Tax=unclassified Mesorhizobium TaxID=325217 RepID=UPI0033380A4E
MVAAADNVDAHIIACFDDTGLDAARAIATKPVIGIGEASLHAVSLVAHSFCVVTTLSRSVPIIEDNIRRYGFSHRCRRVLASDIPVLDLERPESGASERISELIREGIRLGAEGVALGCAGMAEFASALQRKHDIHRCGWSRRLGRPCADSDTLRPHALQTWRVDDAGPREGAGQVRMTQAAPRKQCVRSTSDWHHTSALSTRAALNFGLWRRGC